MIRHSVRSILAVITTLIVANPASAEVLDSAAHGFTVSYAVPIEADPLTVYDAAVTQIDQWWSSDHTVSGNAANLYMTTTIPGCFCEALGDGTGLVHMTISFLNPGVMVRLTGGLGPLGLMGVSGNMTWEFDESDSGTVVTLQYAVGGYLQGGLDVVAPAVDGVLVEAMNRLKTFVETGSAEQG